MDSKVKGFGILFAVICIAAWSFFQTKGAMLGSTGNNGVATDMPSPPPDMRKTMEEARKNRPPDATPPDFSNPMERDKMRAEFESKIPPEQRAQMDKFRAEMKERMDRTNAALSPEDQKAMREKMRARFSRGGPGGRGRGGRPPGGPPGGGPPPAP